MGVEVYHLLVLAALASGALFMHILSCVLYNNWWPILALLAYVLMPLPLAVIARARSDGFLESGSAHALRGGEFIAAFVLMIIVGLPFVLQKANVIEPGAVMMNLSGFILTAAAAVFGGFVSSDRDSEFG